MKLILAAFTVLLLTVPAYGQDFTDLLGNRPADVRREGRIPMSASIRPNRVDLRLSPQILPILPGSPSANRGRGELGVRANMDLDFVCGKFDLRATFGNLLGKEMREEYIEGVIGYLESELTGSAMELLCQAQPTLCTLMQNNNIAANLKLGYHYDRCQAIESAVDRGQRSIYAGALEACLRQKQVAGVPMDQALADCRQTSQVRGLNGNLIYEFDLGREILDLVGPERLSPGARDLVTNIAEQTTYGPSWTSSTPNGSAVVSRHDALTRQYLGAWEDALGQASSSTSSLDDTVYDELSPPGAPRVSSIELERLLLLPPQDQRIAVGSLASAAAFGHLTREIHEVERALESLAGLPSIEEPQRKMLESRMTRLRKERQRLQETYSSQEIYNGAYLAVKRMADRRYAEGIARQRIRERVSVTGDARARTISSWGSRTPSPRGTQRFGSGASAPFPCAPCPR